VIADERMIIKMINGNVRKDILKVKETRSHEWRDEVMHINNCDLWFSQIRGELNKCHADALPDAVDCQSFDWSPRGRWKCRTRKWRTKCHVLHLFWSPPCIFRSCILSSPISTYSCRWWTDIYSLNSLGSDILHDRPLIGGHNGIYGPRGRWDNGNNCW